MALDGRSGTDRTNLPRLKPLWRRLRAGSNPARALPSRGSLLCERLWATTSQDPDVHRMCTKRRRSRSMARRSVFRRSGGWAFRGRWLPPAYRPTPPDAEAGLHNPEGGPGGARRGDELDRWRPPTTGSAHWQEAASFTADRFGRDGDQPTRWARAGVQAIERHPGTISHLMVIDTSR
jgi:hypothetical protein